MRIILIFLVGLLSCFFVGDLISRFTKRPSHNYIGLVLFISSLVVLFAGRLVIDQPLDVLIGTFLMGSGTGLMVHHLLSKQFLFNKARETRFVIKHRDRFERALEIMPGLLTWVALTSPIWLSFTLPYVVAYLIIIADVYWLLNALKLATLLFVGYGKLEHAKKQPWLEMVKKDFEGQWEDYYHLILLPRYNESLEVIGPAMDAVINSNYPQDRIFFALGLEERAKAEITQDILDYIKKNENKIAGFFTTIHPYGLPNEVPGPGTNRNWMVKNALVEFKKRKIDISKVIVTTLDADFVLHPEFLAGAMHKYLSTPADLRLKRSYTGSFLYYNNYWQTAAPYRLIATGTAFWQLAEMVGSDKYMNFSSMSINMKSLTEIGGWMGNKVNDDSGFFWKAYFHFNGDYKVIPHYLPITADAVLDTSMAKTFQNQYLQLKRWAYGVEHIPYIFENYFLAKDLDFWDKTDKLIFAMWGYLRWGMLALFVTFASFFIPLINQEYSQSAVAVNLPIISSWMLTIAFFGLFATVFVHEKTVPPRPKKWGLVSRIWSYLQWLLLPIVMITISTIPAIDAQTTLMFGKKIQFRTTNKARNTTAQ